MREATRRARTSRTLAPVAHVVTISLLLAACGGGEGEGGNDDDGQDAADSIDRSRMAAVAEAEDATASDIVEAGSAVDAASSADAVLVTYTVHQGTSEGRSAAAWRLYDAAGDAIATEKAGVTEEGAAFTSVVALPGGGFLVDAADGPEWYVGPDGAVEPVGRERGRVTAQTGDIALADGSTRLYRPSTRTTFTPTPRAPGSRQGWTLTDDGAQWVQRLGRDGDVPFSRSTQQGTWEPAASYAPDRGRVVSSLALTAVGDQIVVPLTAEGPAPDEASLVGLLVRRDAAPPGRPWELLEARDVGGRGWWDTSASAVDPHTVAVATSGSPPYLVDLEDRTWTQMGAPTGEEGWSFDFEEGRVFATHSEHADAWVSDDRGEGWSRLPH